MPWREAEEPIGVAQLSVEQLDTLRELANVGAGHAATALSQMTGRRVDIDVPTVSVAAQRAIAEIMGPGQVLLVRLRAEEPLASGLAILLDERAAATLTDLLLDRTTTGEAWFDAIGASAIKEVGNVLGAAYVTALSQATGWTIGISTPDLVFARAAWAVEMLAVDGRASDYAICLETAFLVDGSPAPVRGHVLLFPQPATVPALLAAVGMA